MSMLPMMATRSAMSTLRLISEITLRLQKLGVHTLSRKGLSLRFMPQDVGLWVEAFPNPLMNGQALNLRMEAAPERPVRIALYDGQGRLHQQQTLPASTLRRETRLTVATLPTGVYVLHVTDGKAQHVQRVMLR
jgi:hypothetical protein